MVSSTHAAITSSENPNWRTPRWLFNTLTAEFHFVLDAAASTDNTRCGAWLGPGSPLGIDDALDDISWNVIALSIRLAHPTIFINPPYSRKAGIPIEPWVERIAREGETITVVAVLPYSPQTRWWREFVEGDTYCATEIRRFPFRVKFDPPPDYVGKAPGANVNTVVAIYKPTADYVGRWAPLVRYWAPDGCPRRTRTRTVDDDDDE